MAIEEMRPQKINPVEIKLIIKVHNITTNICIKLANTLFFANTLFRT